MSTSTPRVYNRHKKYPPGCVYVGRPTKWGNDFRVGRDGDLETVLRKYYEWLITDGPIDDIHELRGKNLLCWCAPKECHAGLLLELANE